jgi:hypothetical protein
MGVLFLPWHYLFWHYCLAWLDIGRLYYHFVVATARFFSLHILIRTWWSPWRRLGEAYPQRFSPNEFLAALLVNTLMRLVGVVIRSVLLVVGVAATVVVALLGLVAIVLWLLLPAIIAALLLVGLLLLFGLKP